MIRPHDPAGPKSRTRPTLSFICAAALFLVIVSLSGQTPAPIDPCAGARDLRLTNGKIATMDARGSTVGEITIQNGKLVESRLTFFTTHTPQFGSEPVTIRWNGTIDGNLIRFNESDDSGVAHGVAHRRAAP